MEICRMRKFSRELKRLSKRYRSFSSDLEKLEQVLMALPRGTGGKHWNRLHSSSDGSVIVFKVRLACKSLQGQSLLRVIYACQMEDNVVVRIDLIELYYKGEQTSENKGRIEEYLKGECSV